MKTIVSLLLLIASPVFADSAWVNRTLAKMTLEEKIGQLIMARSAPGQFRPSDSPDWESVRRAITEFHVGSLSAGIGEASSVALANNELQRLAKVPLLIAANLEAGAGYTLYGATRMPMAMAIGATGDEKLAYEAGRVTAEEGRAVGVNVNFYPVADVNNNPANPIINIRSFGEDPATVSRFVVAYIHGLQEHGQLATAKHFPGHGDVDSDSHMTMPTLEVTRERLDAVELPPFRAAIDAGVATFMSAHIWLPKLEPEKGVPATLSKPIMTSLLRDEMKFGGLIFTDSMGMRGVTAGFDNAEASVRAIEAGNDVLVTPPSVEDAFNALLAAVKSGRLSEARIDASVRRVLAAKDRLGLPKNRFVDVNQLPRVIGTAANQAVAQTIADRAFTLVKGDANVLPFRRDMNLLQINILDRREGWREGTPGRVVTAELSKRFPKATTITIDDGTSAAEYDLLRKLASLSDAIAVNGFIRVAAYKGSISLEPKQMTLVRDLIAMKKPLLFTAFGSPYVINAIPELPAYAVTYDISAASETAAVKAMAGEIVPRARKGI